MSNKQRYTPIRTEINNHIKTINAILNDKELLCVIDSVASSISKALLEGKRIFIFGCGGSAADSQHIAAEFINKLNFQRRALPAIALTTDSSILTAIGNDVTFDEIFSRQVEGLAEVGDIVIGISTSGLSRSVLNGLSAAKKKNAVTILFTGRSYREAATPLDFLIIVPSRHTPRIQEAHITIAHIICSLVEREVCNESC